MLFGLRWPRAHSCRRCPAPVLPQSDLLYFGAASSTFDELSAAGAGFLLGLTMPVVEGTDLAKPHNDVELLVGAGLVMPALLVEFTVKLPAPALKSVLVNRFIERGRAS